MEHYWQCSDWKHGLRRGTLYQVQQIDALLYMKSCDVPTFCVLVVIIVYSSGKSRIKFNTFSLEWSKCMEMCPKYNRAQVPSFTDQTEMEKLISWALETTTDPDTNLIYPDGFSQSFWVPFRYETMLLQSITEKIM